MGHEELIGKSQISLVVMPKGRYRESLGAVIKAVDSASKKICYITLNKPHDAMIHEISGLGLDAAKYFFIDAITATVKSPAPADNCEFIQSPSALTEISVAFTRATTAKGCDNAIFDSISTLMVYQETSEILKLTHTLITKARVNNTKSAYITLKEDSESLIKDLSMFVDAIIEL